MSYHPSAREAHEAHEDERTRVRQAVRLEEALTAGRLAGELHVRRLGALLQSEVTVEDPDFPGCVW